MAVIAVSVVGALVPSLRSLLALWPEAFWGGYVWQPLTYAFIEDSPLGVIFGALIVWSLGGALEQMWGRRRLVRFSLGVTSAAGLATVVWFWLLPSWTLPGYLGGMVLTSSLWVAFGLHIGPGQTNFWGFAVTGNVLALIGAGFLLLNVVFARSIVGVVPEIFGMLFTFLYMRGVSPSHGWLRFRSWLLQRDLRKRSAHLKSVDGGKNKTGSGSDKYWH